ncbi:helix-turn-helix transcriptional regulator [Porphyromonas endodontalis]|uniref:helix-turn-helix domain-containing protein n=1 Tax=Porphyromonas endodontalis TaxID=28124 RepID=UPI0028EB9E18|nr:helix-turn-helix transcriptional regulator [Porphyromonas endodontalis]
MKLIYEIIKRRREEFGYSLDYVSDKLAVSPSTISRWENGLVDIRLNSLRRYLTILEWSIEDLFAQTAIKPPRVALKTFVVHAYTEEGYTQLLNLFCKAGWEHLDFESNQ